MIGTLNLTYFVALSALVLLQQTSDRLPVITGHTGAAHAADAQGAKGTASNKKHNSSTSSVISSLPHTALPDKPSSSTTGNGEASVRIVSIPSITVNASKEGIVSLVLTGVLIVVGIAGICVAGSTLQTIVKQTKATEMAADAAKVSADAALLNAQVMISTERALIEVDVTAPSTHIDPETGEELSGVSMDASIFRYGISIINHGRTVARIISYKLWYDCFAKDFRRDAFNSSTEITQHMLLGANNSKVVGHFEVDQLFTDWQSIRDRTKTGMLRIDVRYDDIISGKTDQPHETSAIFHYAGEEEGPRRLPQYNVYT